MQHRILEMLWRFAGLASSFFKSVLNVTPERQRTEKQVSDGAVTQEEAVNTYSPATRYLVKFRQRDVVQQEATRQL